MEWLKHSLMMYLVTYLECNYETTHNKVWSYMAAKA